MESVGNDSVTREASGMTLGSRSRTIRWLTKVSPTGNSTRSRSSSEQAARARAAATSEAVRRGMGVKLECRLGP